MIFFYTHNECFPKSQTDPDKHIFFISELKNTNFRLITFLIYNSKKADKLSKYFKTYLRN